LRRAPAQPAERAHRSPDPAGDGGRGGAARRDAERDAIAAGVFALAAVTDTLDGYIARQRDAITTFGKLMDPIADKLLVAAALIALVSLNRLAAWIAMVIIAREFAVTGLRLVAVEQGVVIQASWLGKVKTILQVAAIICLIAFDPTPLAVDLLVYAAVAATVVSGVDYFFGFRRMVGSKAPKPTA
jgi:CDP-diacylglycerol---glycerol-3-phosphate 3-phosphatidyltransferase